MPDSPTLYTAFAATLDAALAQLLPVEVPRAAVTVEPPRDPAHGDLATNAAMVLAKAVGTNPRALAEQIAAAIARDAQVSEATVAGPGFINVRLADGAWLTELAAIAALGPGYGRSRMGHGRMVNVEYV